MLAAASHTGTCPTFDNSTGVLLVAPTAGGNFTYTVQKEGHFWLYDPAGANCANGVKIMFMVSPTCTDPTLANGASPTPSSSPAPKNSATASTAYSSIMSIAAVVSLVAMLY